MNALRRTCIWLLAFACLSLIEHAVPSAVAQEATETPIGKPWWPSPWGADDERGAANRWTAEKTLSAAKLIRQGKTWQLGRVYEHGMPIPGKRHYSLTIPGLPTGAPSAANQLVHNDELVSGEIGQIGTQFDGLGHVGVRVGNDDRFYNGFKLVDFGDTYGLKRLGVEKVGPIFTRGLLLDVAAHRKVRSLKAGDVIKPTDLEGCLEAAGLEIEAGDAVLIRTGHGQLWMADNEQYAAGEPGIGVEAARWLTDRQVSLVGADNWALEVVPAEDPDRPFDAHLWLLVRHGVYILENLDLESLAADKAYEFAFVFAPLRLKGATGSPGNPIAVR